MNVFLTIEKHAESFAETVKVANLLAEKDREIALDGIYELCFDKASEINNNEFPENFLNERYFERPKSCSMNAHKKKRLGLPLTDEETEELHKFYSKHPVFAPDYTDDELDEELECKRGYENAEDKVAYIEQIINDKELSAFKRATLVWYCTYSAFNIFHLIGYTLPKEYTDRINWQLMLRVLEMEEDFLLSDEHYNYTDREEDEDWNMYDSYNTINLMLTYAVLGDIDNYKSYINLIFEDVRYDIEMDLKKKSYVENWVNIRSMHNSYLCFAYNGMMAIRKPSWILPYLIRFAEGWKAYADKNNMRDESIFFPIYKDICECAEEAWREENVPEEFQQDFLEISGLYHDKMNKIAGKNYTFRRNS